MFWSTTAMPIKAPPPSSLHGSTILQLFIFFSSQKQNMLSYIYFLFYVFTQFIFIPDLQPFQFFLSTTSSFSFKSVFLHVLII